MKNFGIGMALTMSGFACYLLTDNAVKWLVNLEGTGDLADVISVA